MTIQLNIENPVVENKSLQLMEAIQQRRSFSLKQLLPDPIDLDDVALMLEAANWAPSHGQTEPWRFTVYSGAGRAGLREAFAAAYRLLTPPEKQSPAGEASQSDRVWAAPVWISLGMAPNPRMPEIEEIMAFACAAQNAHLMASSLGLGCKWTSNAVATHPHVAQFVGLEPPAQLFGFLYVGRPAVDWPASSRGPVAEKVRWVNR